MRPRKITTQPNGKPDYGQGKIELGGWLDGPERTYLWIGEPGGVCRGTLDGDRLYRLAVAIVRQMEMPSDA